MNTLIEVQSYGDFDVQVTDAIMIAPPEMGNEMVEALMEKLELKYSKRTRV